jgi:hypothetical protein
MASTVQPARTKRTPTVAHESNHITHQKFKPTTDRSQGPTPKVAVAKQVASIMSIKSKTLKRTHKNSHSKHTASCAVNDEGIEFATSPDRGAKRVHIRATPEKMKQIQADARETIRMEFGQTKATQETAEPEELDDDQCKWQSVHRGLMAPSGEALKHPAADMLLEFSMKGCPVETGPKWTKAMLDAALAKGAHPSAMEPEAAAQLRAESIEKANQGFCRLVPWIDIKDDPPANLKILFVVDREKLISSVIFLAIACRKAIVNIAVLPNLLIVWLFIFDSVLLQPNLVWLFLLMRVAFTLERSRCWGFFVVMLRHV